MQTTYTTVPFANRKPIIEEELKKREGAVHIGDIFYFPHFEVRQDDLERFDFEVPSYFRWTVVLKHPDSGEWYVLPTDDVTNLASPIDIVIPGVEFGFGGGQSVLRPGSGIWLTTEQLLSGERHRVVPPYHMWMEKVRHVMECLFLAGDDCRRDKGFPLWILQRQNGEDQDIEDYYLETEILYEREECSDSYDYEQMSGFITHYAEKLLDFLNQ